MFARIVTSIIYGYPSNFLVRASNPWISVMCVYLAMSLPTKIAWTQQVEALISADETYVGASFELQVQIKNAEKFELPAAPEIDGCKTELVGTPTRSSRITIINGRRSESQSVTAVYAITPLRPGTFIIPTMEVIVDGKSHTLQPYEFVALTSETGDLMFVEITGEQKKVFVGQPLDLELEILVKPYRDQRRDVTLSDGDMWRLVSNNTLWGAFGDRIEEMAADRTRPTGKKVTRADDNGELTTYYAYQIEATIYPDRPGKITGDNVRVILNYPTEIRRSRDPFAGVFRSSALTVSKYRPIIASASFETTEVLPVPDTGRPKDYRGAVGAYRMLSDASPKNLAAGDPITLKIAIVGDGPLSLIQAPPLAEIETITADFKVDEQELAGIVQNGAKIFETTIRPRRSGVNAIPAIPFSFFDPKREEYKTVYSEPIQINVSDAEQLSLDSIVGRARSSAGNRDDELTKDSTNAPDFENQFSETILESDFHSTEMGNVWRWLIVPPMLFCFALLFRSFRFFVTFYQHCLPAKQRATMDISAANSPNDLANAFARFVQRRFRIREPLSVQSSIGTLRSNGMAELAVVAEKLINQSSRAKNDDLSWLKSDFEELIGVIDETFRQKSKPHIRKHSDLPNRRFMPNSWVLVLFAFHATGSYLLADDPNDLALSSTKIRSIFQAANRVYQAAGIEGLEPSQSVNQFAVAAVKYQTLIDSGIENPRLYLNLGNAQVQSNQTSQAIASYLRGLRLDPGNRTLRRNLAYARKSTGHEDVKKNNFTDLFGWNSQSQLLNGVFVGLGQDVVFWLTLISSAIFWGALSVRIIGIRMPWLGFVLFLSGLVQAAGIALLSAPESSTAIAVVTSDTVELRTGDGDEFSVLESIESANGMELPIVSERQNWLCVRTSDDTTGWIKKSLVIQVQ